MCGRYMLSTPVGTLADEFGIVGPLPELQPSHNVAPTQECRLRWQRGTPAGDVEVGFNTLLDR